MDNEEEMLPENCLKIVQEIGDEVAKYCLTLFSKAVEENKVDHDYCYETMINLLARVNTTALTVPFDASPDNLKLFSADIYEATKYHIEALS